MTPALSDIIAAHPGLVIAVSGGVDSMTLASFAHLHGSGITMVHAVSPAVPIAATERVEAMARHQGWQLTLVGSGEFEDARYRDNPVDRCYFCKTHLYDRIRHLSDGPIASGANLDDLSDFRPGLRAASERQVLHPFVDAQMDKAAVRVLARRLDLGPIAELPAQPCLASRVETGIAIAADDLAFIDMVEVAARDLCPPGADVRGRITRGGFRMELSEIALPATAEVEAFVSAQCRDHGRIFAGMGVYTKGAMFLR